MVVEMKELKLRIWHEERGWSNGLDYLVVTDPLNRIIIYTEDEKKDISLYSGLKDANGLEIYAGDLIKFLRSGKITKVYFENGAFWLEDFGTGSSYGYENILCRNNLGVEVIGNIYES